MIVDYVLAMAELLTLFYNIHFQSEKKNLLFKLVIREQVKYARRQFLHEGSNMHEDTFARRVIFARRVSFERWVIIARG